MHEIAGEVWRSAGGDKEAVGLDDPAGALPRPGDPSPDRALGRAVPGPRGPDRPGRGHDEHARRVGPRGPRADRPQRRRPRRSPAEVRRLAAGVGQIRAQLDEVSRQVAAAFQTLADRDQEIVDTLQVRIREHGELVAQETARISQAMQEYVQQGVETMGQLAGSADSSMQAMSAHDDESEARASASVDQQISELAEQLQLLYDRTGIAMTSLHESVSVPRRSGGRRGARATRGDEPRVRDAGRSGSRTSFGRTRRPSDGRWSAPPRLTTRASPGCWTSG